MRVPIHAAMLLCLSLSLSLVGCSGSPGDAYLDRMADEHAGDRPVASPATAGQPSREVETSDPVYLTEPQSVRGFLARPATLGSPAPGILVIHEWWGLNDNIRKMTRKLAGEGYVALAVDLYEGSVAEDRDRARELAGHAARSEDRVRENLRAAYRYLVDEAGADRIGVIGWCFGGGWSLQTALMLGDSVDAAVIYYGRLTSDRQELAALQAPVLGLFGELDSGIPPDAVRGFESALAELGKPATIHIYPGAGHAFANPSGTRYEATAAEDAWSRTVAFLDENLRPRKEGE